MKKYYIASPKKKAVKKIPQKVVILCFSVVQMCRISRPVPIEDPFHARFHSLFKLSLAVQKVNLAINPPRAANSRASARQKTIEKAATKSLSCSFSLGSSQVAAQETA